MKEFWRLIYGTGILASFVLLLGIAGGYQKDTLTGVQATFSFFLVYALLLLFGYLFIKNEKRRF